MTTLREKILSTLFLEKNQEWLLFYLLSILTAVHVAAYTYLKLATVRPLLVFVLVNNAAPPVCGFCVLGM